MIKKIYAFGTSHSAGGGFEFNNSMNNSPNPNIYKKIFNSENHYDFSFPSILGRLSDIQVINHAKQGYGYERVNRKIIETISSEDFDKNTSLFLIEVSYWDRKEWFIDNINDYIICNFHPKELEDINNLSYANDYFYEKKSITDEIVDYKKVLNDFLKLTHTNFDYLRTQLENSFVSMISLLESLGIKYYLTNGDIPLNPNLYKLFNYKDKILEYEFYNFKKDKKIKLQDWTDRMHNLNLTITHESNHIIKDNHQGYSVSYTIAQTIYNKMIDDGYIESNKLDIDFVSNWNSINLSVGNMII